MQSTSSTQASGPATRIDANERAYLGARLLLILALTVLFAFGIMNAASAVDRALYAAGTAVLVLDTAILIGLAFGSRIGVSAAMVWLAIPDIVVFAAFTYLGRPDDSFYPVVIVGPLFFALCSSRRTATLVGFGAAAAYGIGVLFVGPLTPATGALYGLKLAVVPVITFLIATAVSMQREREQHAETSAAEMERLNNQLRRRVHEMQAVSEITELIHSSLDFDSVGPQMLAIVAKAIAVTTCCLFVIDKERSETLFSASHGTSSLMSEPESGIASAEMAEEHLTCVPVFDHGSVMVLFCTTPEALAGFSDEERLVLSAVASELVVAVENSRLYKLTRRLSITDELTGLANYRQLQQRLDDEIARAERYDKTLSLLMLDADDFKAFNDSHGHVAGDEALAELGPIMRSLVREVDLVARYGGEEFSVLLPETDAAGAFVVAEKIREAVELHRFAGADGERVNALTVSVGFATFPTHGSDKDDLLRLADDALYHAKDGGKNRVRAPHRKRDEIKSAAAEKAPATDEWTGA